jgi:hypothetical protein
LIDRAELPRVTRKTRGQDRHKVTRLKVTKDGREREGETVRQRWQDRREEGEGQGSAKTDEDGGGEE